MTIIDFLGKLLLPLNCTTQNPLLSDGIFEEIRKLLYHMIRLKQMYCFSSLRKQRCQIIGVREYISALIFLPLVKYVFCLFPIYPHKCTKKTNKQNKTKIRTEKQTEKGYALLEVIPQYYTVHPVLRLKSARASRE